MNKNQNLISEYQKETTNNVSTEGDSKKLENNEVYDQIKLDD